LNRASPDFIRDSEEMNVGKRGRITFCRFEFL
jgi:hypothetical protein